MPGNLIIGIYANANSLGGVYQGKNNTVVTIPKGTTRVELRILRGGVTAGSVSGNLKIQLRTREHRARVDETRCHKP